MRSLPTSPVPAPKASANNRGRFTKIIKVKRPLFFRPLFFSPVLIVRSMIDVIDRPLGRVYPDLAPQHRRTSRRAVHGAAALRLRQPARREHRAAPSVLLAGETGAWRGVSVSEL